jgi:hypothetical protein
MRSPSLCPAPVFRSPHAVAPWAGGWDSRRRPPTPFRLLLVWPSPSCRSRTGRLGHPSGTDLAPGNGPRGRLTRERARRRLTGVYCSSGEPRRGLAVPGSWPGRCRCRQRQAAPGTRFGRRERRVRRGEGCGHAGAVRSPGRGSTLLGLRPAWRVLITAERTEGPCCGWPSFFLVGGWTASAVPRLFPGAAPKPVRRPASCLPGGLAPLVLAAAAFQPAGEHPHGLAVLARCFIAGAGPPSFRRPVARFTLVCKLPAAVAPRIPVIVARARRADLRLDARRAGDATRRLRS